MSSFLDQAEYLRKKKEEILAKKKAEKEKNESQKDTKPQAAIPFANDGSFLEKFKTMQNNPQQKSSSSSTTTSIKKEPLDFANDGSFLEKYKAMQQQQQPVAAKVKEEPSTHQQSKPSRHQQSKPSRHQQSKPSRILETSSLSSASRKSTSSNRAAVFENGILFVCFIFRTVYPLMFFLCRVTLNFKSL